ncbi:MAG: hypothetical protein P9M03_04515, partial [Candidatus Theseobacter exili]|nr:hypothetical protein [Candidatus Theseobacter exili]
MDRRRPVFLKFIAVVISVSMLLDWSVLAGLSVAHAEVQLASSPVISASKVEFVPAQIKELLNGCMRIEGEWISPENNRTMFLIRDLHCHEEAQLCISSAIKKLQKKMGTGLVFLEGAEGAFNLQLFSAFPVAEIRDKVSRDFMREGCITGAEYAALSSGINSGFRLYGVENSSLYVENLKVFRTVRELISNSSSIFETVDGVFNDISERVFSERLQELFRIRKMFREGNGKIKDAVSILEICMQQDGVVLNDEVMRLI